MSAPALGRINRTSGIAGQVSYSVNVTYPNEKPQRITFTSSVYGGSVLMRGRYDQTWVTDPGRFGPFGPEWVRRFFA